MKNNTILKNLCDLIPPSVSSQIADASDRWVSGPQNTPEREPSIWKSALTGAAAGATTGGASGFYAGTGVGLASGGVGLPAAPVFGTVGAVGGAVVGFLGGIVYHDHVGKKK